jgi:hypothetical protein
MLRQRLQALQLAPFGTVQPEQVCARPVAPKR